MLPPHLWLVAVCQRQRAGGAQVHATPVPAAPAPRRTRPPFPLTGSGARCHRRLSACLSPERPGRFVRRGRPGAPVTVCAPAGPACTASANHHTSFWARTPGQRTHLPQILMKVGAGMHPERKGPQRRTQKRLGRRLEEVAQAVGGGYYRLQMPLRLALSVRGTVAGHTLGALEGCAGSAAVRHPLPRGGMAAWARPPDPPLPRETLKGEGGGTPCPPDSGPGSTPKAFPSPNTSPQPHFQPPVTAPQPLSQSPVTAL